MSRYVGGYLFESNSRSKTILMPVRVLALIVVLASLFACDSSNTFTSDYQKAYDFCVGQGGAVEQRLDSKGNLINVCRYQEVATYDDGVQTHTMVCELQSFYDGRCNDGLGSDYAHEAPPLLDACPGCPKTVREMIDDQVLDVLAKLDNTGYSHRPFDLHPDYAELASQTTSSPNTGYDLFLDCSGFVGYYVLQGVAKPLYEKLPRRYSCGPLSFEEGVVTSVARPLAADFHDHFLREVAAFGGGEAFSLENACWSRVEHISDALPGDVIVYLHEENLDLDTQYCCRKEGSLYKAGVVADESACADGRITYKAKTNSDGSSRNTGHVLFVREPAYRSKEKKDSDGIYQWVVEVVDSTTAPHMYDSRKVGEENSVYGSNYYHAWTRGDEKYVQRCADGSYHRDCMQHNTSQVGENIEINTVGDHATGIGVGRIYVNHDMSGYRVNFSHETEHARVVIGRPVVCE